MNEQKFFKPTLKELISDYKLVLSQLRGLSPDNSLAVDLLSKLKGIRQSLHLLSMQRIEYQQSGIYNVPLFNLDGIHPDIITELEKDEVVSA